MFRWRSAVWHRAWIYMESNSINLHLLNNNPQCSGTHSSSCSPYHYYYFVMHLHYFPIQMLDFKTAFCFERVKTTIAVELVSSVFICLVSKQRTNSLYAMQCSEWGKKPYIPTVKFRYGPFIGCSETSELAYIWKCYVERDDIQICSTYFSFATNLF